MREVARGWARLDPDRLRESFTSWMGSSVDALTLAQTETALGVDAYVSAFISFETGRPSVPLGFPVGEFVGRSAGGGPLVDVLRQPIALMTGQLNDGADFASAARQGLARGLQVVDTQVHETSRVALGAVMTVRDEVVGYRRVTSGGCGACLAAATGAIHETSEALDVHPHCHCSTEPVVKGVPDVVARPTGQEMFDAMPHAEQDALFERRGGAEKAELIRSGRVSLADLLSGDRTPDLGRGLIETPLGSITQPG